MHALVLSNVLALPVQSWSEMTKFENVNGKAIHFSISIWAKTPRGTNLYKAYEYVPPQSQKVWCLRRFGLKTGVGFAHFGLESGMVF